MAKKVIRVSEISGEESREGTGATIRVTFAGARQECAGWTSPTRRRTSAAAGRRSGVAGARALPPTLASTARRL